MSNVWNLKLNLEKQILISGQLEAKMKSMAESIQEVEVKKRHLEEHVSIKDIW